MVEGQPQNPELCQFSIAVFKQVRVLLEFSKDN